MSDAGCRMPIPLTSGQAAEAAALGALGLAKNTAIWRPTDEQVRSPDFRRIVGHPAYTPTGLTRGTVLDSVDPVLAEIKSGASPLDSTYQLRLQTYRSVVEKQPLTLYTSRPLAERFGRWLGPHGVRVQPLPEPEP